MSVRAHLTPDLHEPGSGWRAGRECDRHSQAPVEGEVLRAGIGLRAVHHHEIIASRPDVGWLEAHSENYFARGGPLPRILAQVRERYPLSLHGVGLSIGSTDPLDRAHLTKIARLVRDYEPMLVSEHLSWSSVGGRFTNDLLPLPGTEEALRHVIHRVQQVQDFLGRQILIENVSSYLEFACSDIPEWDFLSALAREAGCGLLLDVNNVYVSAMNHGFDPHLYLDRIPSDAVREMHLAGHSILSIGGREMRIDTHDAPVCDDVWALYATALERFGPVPTLIEWDANIPTLTALAEEAHKADRTMAAHRARAARPGNDETEPKVVRGQRPAGRLDDLQIRFADALFEGAAEAITPHIVSAGIGAGERLEIYRNNLREGFIRALTIGFPVIERLVGVDYFRQLALDFLRAHPSRAGDLHHIGRPFPAFLRERFASTEYAYLSDVAALEWAREEALTAADATPISSEALRAIDPASYEQLRFDLHPACGLVQSAYPIVRIWCANQPEATGEEVIDLREGGDAVLVLRTPEGVEFHRLPAGDFAALAACACGRPLGVVLEAAQAAEATFDPGAALRRFMRLNLLVAFHVSSENRP